MAQNAAETTPYRFSRSRASVNQYIKKVKLLHHMASKIFTEALTRYKALPDDLQAERVALTSEFGGVEDILHTMWEPFLRRLGKTLGEAEQDFEKGDWDCATLAAQTVEEMVVPVRAIIKELDVLLKELEATAKERRGGGSEDGEVVPTTRMRSKSREPEAKPAESAGPRTTNKRTREASDDGNGDQALPPAQRRRRQEDTSPSRRESARLAGRSGQVSRNPNRRQAPTRPMSRPAPRTRLDDLVAAGTSRTVSDRRETGDRSSEAQRNDQPSRAMGRRSPAPRRRG